jgi:hypothetical protein
MVGRRELLLQAKVKGLVRSRWGDVVDEAGVVGGGFPSGAALLDPAAGTAWVLLEDDPVRGLGGAVVWADRRQATHLHLLAAADGPTLARRAALLDRSIDVWTIAGTALEPAPPAPLDAPAGDPPAELERFRALFEQAGADSVYEHGVLRAEVRGLEVARVEPDVLTGEPRLRVGVGKHDREAQQEIHGDEQGLDHLFEVVRIVAEHRVADGAGHAAYHLGPERWLRSVVLRRPDLAGAADLVSVAPPLVRDDLRQSAPAPARGVDAATGEPLLVVCSVGTDLDLVPSAIDAYLADGRQPIIRFVLPEGDDHRATRDLVAALRPKADIVTVSREWRRL